MFDLVRRLACEFDLEPGRAPTQGRIVRHGQRDTQEMENRRSEALSLAKREMKELTDRQQGKNGWVSILDRRSSAARLSGMEPGVN
jgi:hypothetical protein